MSDQQSGTDATPDAEALAENFRKLANQSQRLYAAFLRQMGDTEKGVSPSPIERDTTEPHMQKWNIFLSSIFSRIRKYFWIFTQ